MRTFTAKQLQDCKFGYEKIDGEFYIVRYLDIDDDDFQGLGEYIVIGKVI